MLISLILAAAAPLSAPAPASVEPIPEAGVPVVEAPATRRRGPMPTGSTQPFTPSTRPSIGFLSASSLRDRCEATAATLVSYCFAYITGVHDTVQAYETWLRVREFCPAYTSSQADMRRAFLTYLKANPDAASGEAASVVVLAFKDQFPCTEPVADKPAAVPARKR